MMEPRTARYEWGQRVCAAIDLFNDGSFPEAEEGALLVPAGGLGEIVQIGHHTEANVPIYLVEFGPACVLGVLEEEIALAGLRPTVAQAGAAASSASAGA